MKKIVINKLKIKRDNNSFEINFRKGLNILNAMNNQSGKTTIIYSILFCLGAKKTIWKSHEEKPDICELHFTIGDKKHKIIRTTSSDITLLNDEKVQTLNSILSDDVFQGYIVRNQGRFEQPSIKSVLSHFSFLQRREDYSMENNIFISLSNDLRKDIDRLVFTPNILKEYMAVKKNLDSIKKKKNENKKKLELKQYGVSENIATANIEILDEKIKELEELFDGTRKKYRETFSEERKNRKITEKFIDDIQYKEAVESFINSFVNDISLSKEDTVKVKKKMNSALLEHNDQEYSISDYEEAIILINQIQNNRTKIEIQLKEIRSKIDQIIKTKNIKNIVMNEVIKDLIVENTDDIDEESKNELLREKEIKKQFDVEIKKIDEKIKVELRNRGLKGSDSGISQLIQKVLRMNLYNFKVMPFILDSPEESATQDNYDEKITDLLENMDNQTIVASIRVSKNQKKYVVKEFENIWS